MAKLRNSQDIHKSDDHDRSIAAACRYIRESLGLTPDDMGAVIELDTGYISMTERFGGLTEYEIALYRIVSGVNPYIYAWCLAEVRRGGPLLREAHALRDRMDAELVGRRGGIDALKRDDRWDAAAWGENLIDAETDA